MGIDKKTMDTILTFIIPVRHPDNSNNWEALKSNLSETIQSINAQSNPNWKAKIVANRGADLPDIPEKFEIIHVDFPPNKNYTSDQSNTELFLDAVRLDKGNRILAGMLNSTNSEYFMVVDDDDFVNRDIVEFVSKNRGKTGWKIKDGYIWPNKSKLLFLHDDFSSQCGTSLIIRADLFKLPAAFKDANADYIKTYLGSHIKISDILLAENKPLEILPFPGAIYRVGHSYSHSQTSHPIRKYVLKKSLILKPLRLVKNILSLRLKNSKIDYNFFGLSNK